MVKNHRIFLWLFDPSDTYLDHCGPLQAGAWGLHMVCGVGSGLCPGGPCAASSGRSARLELRVEGCVHSAGAQSPMPRHMAI